ncbi:MAG: DUF3558 domain-containing protein [Actinophytocola sp.]|uniref:DUF3558 domain-containing protein n=1 Tax=Actinophytocola sp. TaxID=1872138 RepID=UPI003D6A2C8C
MASRHRAAAASAAIVLAFSLVACDGGEGADPAPTSATVSFPDDPDKAPAVPNPITPKAFIEKPCTSLTAEQRRKFELDSGEPEVSDVSGSECRYRRADRLVSVRYATDWAGLQDLYRTRSVSTRWEPQVLDGFPAVSTYLSNKSDVPPGPPSCYYAVGLNDLLFFSVVSQDTDGSSECGLAKRIAADVLSTITDDR